MDTFRAFTLLSAGWGENTRVCDPKEFTLGEAGGLSLGSSPSPLGCPLTEGVQSIVETVVRASWKNDSYPDL